MDYLYDGSFEGFLTCVHSHYYATSADEKAGGIFVRDKYPGSLIHKSVFIETDEVKADAVSSAISAKISGFDLRRIYHVFHTEIPEKEMKLLQYIRLGFRQGYSIGLLHGNSLVFEIQTAHERIGKEVHRLCGLVRFSVMQGPQEILYSRIEPDNDVLEFLAPHFTDRFHSDPFIIHDLKRSKALVALKREWYITDFADEDMLARVAGEDEVRTLWRGYFDAMAIKERINPKLQRNMMPARYWKHLIEKQTD